MLLDPSAVFKEIVDQANVYYYVVEQWNQCQIIWIIYSLVYQQIKSTLCMWTCNSKGKSSSVPH